MKKIVEFVNSLFLWVVVDDVGLLSWECLGYDNCCMIGYSVVLFVVDVVLKDIFGVDVEVVYEVICYVVFDCIKYSQVSDFNGMDEYFKYGYVIVEIGVLVFKIIEQNYCDWVIVWVVEKLGKMKD